MITFIWKKRVVKRIAKNLDCDKSTISQLTQLILNRSKLIFPYLVGKSAYESYFMYIVFFLKWIVFITIIKNFYLFCDECEWLRQLQIERKKKVQSRKFRSHITIFNYGFSLKWISFFSIMKNEKSIFQNCKNRCIGQLILLQFYCKAQLILLQ